MTAIIDRKNISDRMINDIDNIDKRKIDQYSYSKLIDIKKTINSFKENRITFDDAVIQIQYCMTGISGEIYSELETDLLLFILTDITSVF
jgi:hypothetical protein